MYKVSQAYKTAIKKRHRRYKVEGTITIPRKPTIKISDADIQQGSLKIDNQCVNAQEFELGSVYAGQLTMTLNTNIDRYSLYGAVVQLTFYLEVSSGVYEPVPLGVYTIIEATRKSRYVSVKALDNMTLLDLAFDNMAVIGTPWEILTLVGKTAKIELANTKAEIEAMPNGTAMVSVPSTFKLSTYRDLVSHLAVILCCFATIDGNGKLVLRRFQTVPADEIDDRFRLTSEFSDFTVNYTSVETTINKKVWMSALSKDTGMRLKIPENPFLQLGLDETKQGIIDNILNGITGISYVPSTVSIYGDPAIELGDLIKFTGASADDGVQCLITNYTYTYRNKHDIKGVGKNPKLSESESKLDKKLTEINNEITKKDIIFFSFTNASAYNVGNGNKQNIISLDFTSQSGGTAEFKASILVRTVALESSADKTTIAKVFYEIDGKEVETYYPIETFINGAHSFFIYYPIGGIKSNKVIRFDAYIEVTGGSVSIDKGQILANISGQGLAAELGDWDGRIEFDEEFDNITLGGMTVGGFEAEVTAELDDPKRSLFEEEFAGISLGGMTVGGFEADLVPKMVIKSNTLDATRKEEFVYNAMYVNTDTRFELQTEYSFTGVEQEIDQGRMSVIEIDTSQFERVDGIEVK